MNEKLRNKDTDFLFDAVLQLRDREECYRFFEDLCTAQELKALSQRVAVAKMLDEKCVFADVEQRTGASTATISRVNRALQYGCDAYRMVFDRLKETKADEE